MNVTGIAWQLAMISVQLLTIILILLRRESK